jgi:hypothetical protein
MDEGGAGVAPAFVPIKPEIAGDPNMTAAGLTFLSWYRQGLVAGVAPPSGGPTLDATGLPAEATLPITLSINDQARTTFDAYLNSPGDVAGFDVNQVIRTDPAPGASNVEPNYLPFIEFARPDLPWMLTPSAPQRDTPADPRRGLPPWLVLVVIPKDAATLVAPSASDGSTSSSVLPTLETTVDQLPDLSESWLWAHAQVLTTGAEGETIDGIIAGEPHRALSRLIAPRRLRANTAYVGCVVPAFDAGRDAGTGQTTSNTTLGWAWQAGDQSVKLPIYYQWEFSTGDEGADFATLARLLTPYDSSGAGTRGLDVGTAASEELGLQGPPWQLNLEGVLVGANVVIGEWDASVPEEAFKKALAIKLDGMPGDLPPPTYGSSQAEFRGPPPAGNTPTPLSGFDTTGQRWFHGSLANGDGATWLRTLNLDPRYRVMAALGTAVVQRYQEALMASAWEQAGELRKVNQVLARGQLAREANGFIYRNRIGANSASAPLADDRLMQITTAIHSQVSAPAGAGAGASIAAAVAQNPSLQSALSTSFRRLTRPSGPLVKRISPTPLPSPVLPIASGAIKVTPLLEPVSGSKSIEAIAQSAADQPLESLAKITPQRVQTPVFPWEPAPSAMAGPAKPRNAAVSPVAPAGPTLAYGFMADLLVTTEDPPPPPAGPDDFFWSWWIGSALDFNGVPQLGWSRLWAADAGKNFVRKMWGVWSNAVAFAVNYVNGSYGYLHRYPGLVGFVLNPTGVAPPYTIKAFYRLIPGYPLEVIESEGGGEVPIDLPHPYETQIAVAATDLNGTGDIDLILVFNDGAALESFLIVARKVDFIMGPQGGWTDRQGFATGIPGAALSVTAMGCQVCVHFSCSPGLIVLTLGPDGMIVQNTTLSQTSLLPSDCVASAIAGAAFGVGGMDIVLCCSAGAGGQLRTEYRLLLDVKGDGSIGEWGEVMSLPIPGGQQMRLLLGVMTSAGDALRTQQTQNFRTAATATQTRQQRILALAAPPPSPPQVPVAPLAQQVRTAIDPNSTVPASVLRRLQLPSSIDPTTPSLSDVLQPAQAGPYFPQPMYETFRDLYPNRIIPGSFAMPDNRATLVEANPKAIEAFLVGLNAYMAHSLLWHGFPGGLQATYFDRFWDARDAAGFALSDITPINGWALDSDLGGHTPMATTGATGASGPLVLLVRAELLRRVPHVTIFAAPVQVQVANGAHTLDVSQRKDPVFSGRLNPDIAFFAFNLTPAAARGDGGISGYYIVFQEQPTAPRFGPNEPPPGSLTFGSGPGRPDLWRNLDWSEVVASRDEYDALTYIVCSKSPLAGITLPDDGSGRGHRFGFSAAHMAHIMFRPAVQVAIHASLLLPAS